MSRAGIVGLACIGALLAGAAGCSSGGGGGDQTRYVTRGLDRADKSVGADTQAGVEARRAAEQRAPVILDGQAIGWETLRPLLAEASGADIVEEVVLGQLVEDECRTRGVTITTADIDAERKLLVETLADTSRRNLPPDQVEQIVGRVRAQRGLGPTRWNDLLRRNAELRALVAGEVVVSQEAIDRMYERVYGPEYPARIIVTSTAIEASQAIERVKNGEPFGVVAAQVSTDASADRGGIIDPINLADPTWPAPMRATVEGLATKAQFGQAGAVSDPILLDSGYAVVWLERAPAPKQAPAEASVQAEMERLVRVEQERLYMQREARRLLGTANVTVLDPSLEWSRQSRGR